MKYHEEIFQYLFESTEEVWMAWLQTHPPLEQVDILHEVRTLITQMMDGLDCSELSNALTSLEGKTNQYQEAILDQQLALLQLEMAEEECAKILKDAELIDAKRKFALDSICSNDQNADMMKRWAIRVMQYEKEAGIYDPEKWWPLSL